MKNSKLNNVIDLNKFRLKKKRELDKLTKIQNIKKSAKRIQSSMNTLKKDSRKIRKS